MSTLSTLPTLTAGDIARLFVPDRRFVVVAAARWVGLRLLILAAVVASMLIGARAADAEPLPASSLGKPTFGFSQIHPPSWTQEPTAVSFQWNTGAGPAVKHVAFCLTKLDAFGQFEPSCVAFISAGFKGSLSGNDYILVSPSPYPHWIWAVVLLEDGSLFVTQPALLNPLTPSDDRPEAQPTPIDLEVRQTSPQVHGGFTLTGVATRWDTGEGPRVVRFYRLVTEPGLDLPFDVSVSVGGGFWGEGSFSQKYINLSGTSRRGPFWSFAVVLLQDGRLVTSPPALILPEKQPSA